jgi:PAS domain S-box-containing protein
LDNVGIEIRNKYQELFECSLDLIFALDLKGNLLDANDLTISTLGYNKEEIINKFFGQFGDNNQIKALLSAIKEITDIGKQTKPFEYKIRTRKGNFIYIKTYGIPIRKNGRFYAILFIANDITNHKTLEEEFNQSIKKYRIITENANDIIGILNDKYEIEYVNEQPLRKISGYERENVIGKNALEFLHPNDVKQAIRGLENGQKYGESKNELRFKLKDGSYRWFEGSGKSIINKKGKNIGIIVLRDIHKRKMAENALKISEERYRKIIQNANDLIFVLNPKLEVEYLNELSVKNLLGYSINDIIGKKPFYFIHPKDHQKVIQAIKKGIKEGKGIAEFRVKDKNGNYHWHQVKGKIFIDVDGKQKALFASRDISDRILVEKKLLASEKKYHHLFDNSPNMIILVDINGNILDFNFTTLKYLKINREEIIGKNFRNLNFIGPEYIKNLKKIYLDLISKRFSPPVEYNINSEEFGIDWIKLSTFLIEIGDQNIIQVIIEDISEKKIAEEKLRLSEEKYRLISEKSNDLIIVLNSNFKFEYVNQVAALNFLGLTRDKLIGKSIRTFLKEEGLTKIYSGMNTLQKVGEISYEGQIKHNSGRWIWCDFQVRLFIEKDGALKFLLTLRDINEKKIAEQQLKESRQRYRLITENINDMIAILDKNFKFEYINEEVNSEIMGYTSEDLIAKSALDLIHKDDYRKAVKLLREGFKRGEGSGIIRYKKKNGEFAWLEVRGKIFKDVDGEQKALLVSRDINERIVAQQKIKDSEAKYRDLFEKSPYSIVLTTPEGIMVEANEATTKIFGFSMDEIINQNYLNLAIYTPKQIRKFTKRYLAMKRGENVEPIELQVRNKDGDLIWIHYQSSLVELNNQVLIQTIIQDITDRKNAEQRLKESEDNYRRITENSNDLIRVVNSKLQIEYINEQAHLKQLGLSKKDIIGKSIIPLMHPEDAKNLNSYLQNIVEKGEATWEQRYKSKDGSWIWFDSTTKRFQDSYGNYKGLVISRNITERKNSELKLRESEMKYRLITENANDLIAVFDQQLRFEFVNEKVHKNLLGYSKEDMIGERLASFIHPEDLKQVAKIIWKRLRHGVGKAELRFRKKDGTYIWLESGGTAYMDKNGSFKGITFSRDVTDKRLFRKKLEEEVKVRTRELKIALDQQKLYLDEILKASKFKSDFLSTMSHELRTPLNAIIGFTDLLFEQSFGPLNDRQTNFLSGIKMSSEHLMDMIGNVLNISKIETGRLKLNIIEFSLNSIMDQITFTLKPLIYKKKLDFEIIGLDSEIKLIADPIVFRQIVYNLLSNAIKFTQQGSVSFIIKENTSEWVFKVKDTGIGIDEKDFDLIFKEFQRVNDPYVKSVPGSGLGLALTKRLIEMHHGEISIISKLGVGTTFEFTIPK